MTAAFAPELGGRFTVAAVPETLSAALFEENVASVQLWKVFGSVKLLLTADDVSELLKVIALALNAVTQEFAFSRSVYFVTVTVALADPFVAAAPLYATDALSVTATSEPELS